MYLILLIERKARRLLREYGAGETPQKRMRREGSSDRHKVREVPGGKSTDKFSTALILKRAVHQLNCPIF